MSPSKTSSSKSKSKTKLPAGAVALIDGVPYIPYHASSDSQELTKEEIIGIALALNTVEVPAEGRTLWGRAGSLEAIEG